MGLGSCLMCIFHLSTFMENGPSGFNTYLLESVPSKFRTWEELKSVLLG